MKEQYVRPLIYLESFSLAQTIAKDCNDNHTGSLGESNHYDAFSCNWVIGEGEGAAFLFFVDACEDSWMIGDPEPEDEIEYEGLCYNNPSGGQTIFSST